MMEEERQLEMALRMSLAMVDGSAGAGGANNPARRSDPGSAMDPSHTFRALVIEMLRGDASARQDLVQAFDDLNQGTTFQSPRLLYFLLDNCKMDKLSKLPENVVGLWMGYLQRAPPQPALRDLIVLEGQLGKQGSKGWSTKGWKMKWFVMTDSFLCYYNKLSDKQEGKEPRKQIPLSAAIRLQMVGADVSGMECSFEIITEQDFPNWKVHANISEDEGESQLYCSRWQSAIEEAMKCARDLDRAFLNAKPQQYWADVDETLAAEANPGARRPQSAGFEAPDHRRQASMGSDGFDPRDVEAPIGQQAAMDPFATEAPAPAPTVDLIQDLLDADTGLQRVASSVDPFGAILFAPDPAPQVMVAQNGMSAGMTPQPIGAAFPPPAYGGGTAAPAGNYQQSPPRLDFPGIYHI